MAPKVGQRGSPRNLSPRAHIGCASVDYRLNARSVRSSVSAHRLYFHLTWSTLRRMPMIDVRTATFLDAFVRRVAVQERVEILELSFLRTHVHMLVRTGPRVDLSRFVQLRKGGSSYAASRQPDNILGLRWNREYSVTSVGPRALSTVVGYIRTQSLRHGAEAIAGPTAGPPARPAPCPAGEPGRH